MSPSYAASPLGSFPELSQMYSSNFSAPLSDAKLGAQSSQDKITVENQRAAAAAARKQANAFSNPKNYTIVPRPDGGFGFYGPDGKEVTAAQYANNTGQKLTDVLKDSQNPIDIRYIQDQQNLTSYLKAKANSQFDPKQKAIAQQIESQVNQAYGIKLNQTNPSQLIQYMQANYPTIYGANQNFAPGFSGSNVFVPGQAGAEGFAKAQNPTGFYQGNSGNSGFQL